MPLSESESDENGTGNDALDAINAEEEQHADKGGLEEPPIEVSAIAKKARTMTVRKTITVEWEEYKRLQRVDNKSVRKVGNSYSGVLRSSPLAYCGIAKG